MTVSKLHITKNIDHYSDYELRNESLMAYRKVHWPLLTVMCYCAKHLASHGSNTQFSWQPNNYCILLFINHEALIRLITRGIENNIKSANFFKFSYLTSFHWITSLSSMCCLTSDDFSTTFKIRRKEMTAFVCGILIWIRNFSRVLFAERTLRFTGSYLQMQLHFFLRVCLLTWRICTFCESIKIKIF